MRKVVIAVVVLLVIAGGVAFALSRFDAFLRDNREWLAERASQAVGREVRFGDIGVSFRGGLGAGLEDFSIADDPAYSDGDFVRVGEANVVIKILPALRGNYEIERIVLVEPQLRVVRRAEGFNFETLAGARGKQAGTEPVPGSDGAGKTAETLPLVISVLDIRDGRVDFVDRTSSPPAELVIEQLDFSASNVGFEEPVGIDLAAALLGATSQNFRVEGSVGPLVSPGDVPKAPLEVSVEIGPVVIDEAKKLALVGDAIPPELSSPDPISIRAEVGGRVATPEVRVGLDVTDAALRFGEMFRKQAGDRLSVSAAVARSADNLELSDLEIGIAKASLKGSGKIGTAGAKPFDFSIQGDQVPLAGWGEMFPMAEGVDVGGALSVDLRATGAAGKGLPNLRGKLGLREVRLVQPGGGIEISGLTTDVALDGDRIEVPATSFLVAGEPVTLSATVSSLANLAARFEVSAEKLGLAALGFGGDGIAKEERMESVKLRGSLQSAAGKPSFRATLRSDAGSVRDVDYASFDAEVGFNDGEASLRQLSVRAFDGAVSGAATFDVDDPQFSFRGRLKNLDVARIVAYLDLTSTLNMTGRLNGDLSLRGAGKEREAITQSMTGDGKVAVEDGVLRDFNLAEGVLSSVTGVAGLSQLVGGDLRKKYPLIFDTTDTVFESIQAQLDVGGGRANLEEMVIAARDYRIDGKGYTAFDGVVDIGASFVASEQLTADLQRSVKETKYLQDGGRLRIPIKIGGRLPDVKPKPDTTWIASRLSAALVSEGVGKGLDKLLGGSKKKPSDTPGKDGASSQNDAAEAAGKLIQKGLEGLLGGD